MKRLKIKNIKEIIGFIENDSLMMAVLFGLLCLVYIFVYERFSYIEYSKFGNDFSRIRFLISILIVFCCIIFGSKIKNVFLGMTYKSFLILYLYGELICWIFNKEQNYYIIIIETAFILSLVPIDNLRLKLPNIRVSVKCNILLIIICIVMFVPFLGYVKYLDLKNLFLINVYETRIIFRGIKWGILGYFVAPLSRVVLPYYTINALEKKKYIQVVFFISMILYLYLCGALKSVFFGLLCALLFMKGKINEKSYRITVLIISFAVFSIIIDIFFGSTFGISILRRVFFVPPRLENYYVEYFSDNYTYYLHSGFSPLSNQIYGGKSISEFMGTVIGSVTNANTGLFVEGYYSFGLIGALVYNFIPWIIVLILKSINFDNKYFGIFFVYIYYMNTAIFSTLLLTHGFFIFMIMAFVYMRKGKRC